MELAGAGAELPERGAFDGEVLGVDDGDAVAEEVQGFGRMRS